MLGRKSSCLLLGALRLDENSGVYFTLLLVMTLDYRGILCQNRKKASSSSPLWSVSGPEER